MRSRYRVILARNSLYCGSLTCPAAANELRAALQSCMGQSRSSRTGNYANCGSNPPRQVTPAYWPKQSLAEPLRAIACLHGNYRYAPCSTPQRSKFNAHDVADRGGAAFTGKMGQQADPARQFDEADPIGDELGKRLLKHTPVGHEAAQHTVRLNRSPFDRPVGHEWTQR